MHDLYDCQLHHRKIDLVVSHVPPAETIIPTDANRKERITNDGDENILAPIRVTIITANDNKAN